MEIEEIKELLPHREPFLFVDRVTMIEGNRIEAYRDIRADEFYFAGHFPGYPVLPGVLMVEAMVQSAAWLTRLRQDFAKSIIVLAAARNVWPLSVEYSQATEIPAVVLFRRM